MAELQDYGSFMGGGSREVYLSCNMQDYNKIMKWRSMKRKLRLAGSPNSKLWNKQKEILKEAGYELNKQD